MSPVGKMICLCSLAFFCLHFFLPITRSYDLSISSTIRVGRCPASTFYQAKQRCSRLFYQTILGSTGRIQDCSCNYIKMQSCMLIAFDNCLQGSILESILGYRSRVIVSNFRTMIGNEEAWCSKGGLRFSEITYEGVNCHPIYAHAAADCVAEYKTTFRSQTTNERLCRVYNQAKMCLIRGFLVHCSSSSNGVSQTMEVSIEAQLHFHPYCSSPPSHSPSLDELTVSAYSCPTNVYADILFLLDVSSNVSTSVYKSMKRLISRAAQKLLKEEAPGIQLAVAQYHGALLNSLSFTPSWNRKAFFRKLNDVRMPSSDARGSRMTGRALTSLMASGQQFDLGRNASGTRPFFTPIIFVITNGPSHDDVTESIRILNEKRVHVARFGPTLTTNNSGYDVTYHVNNTHSYEEYVREIVDEICQADRVYRDVLPTSNSVKEEASYFYPTSPLAAARQHIFSRVSGLHLPLYWEPKPLQLANFTEWQINLQNRDSDEQQSYFNYHEYPGAQPQLFNELPIQEATSDQRRFS